MLTFRCFIICCQAILYDWFLRPRSEQSHFHYLAYIYSTTFKIPPAKLFYPQLARPHLNNIFRRDIGQSRAAQEATTKVCWTHSEEEPTRRRARLAISRKGCGDFPVPLRCGFVAVATATASSPRLADTRKSLATRLEAIVEMGSNR